MLRAFYDVSRLNLSHRQRGSPRQWRVPTGARVLGVGAVIFGAVAGLTGRVSQAEVPLHWVGGPRGSGEIKPLIKGLVSMEDARCLSRDDNRCRPDNSIADAFSRPNMLRGVVVNVTWTELEARAGEFDFRVIDAALQNVERYNVRYSANPLHVILRVETGKMAPDWVKSGGGGRFRFVGVAISRPLRCRCFGRRSIARRGAGCSLSWQSNMTAIL
jgi:hypothetical protein